MNERRFIDFKKLGTEEFDILDFEGTVDPDFLVIYKLLISNISDPDQIPAKKTKSFFR